MFFWDLGRFDFGGVVVVAMGKMISVWGRGLMMVGNSVAGFERLDK